MLSNIRFESGVIVAFDPKSISCRVFPIFSDTSTSFGVSLEIRDPRWVFSHDFTQKSPVEMSTHANAYLPLISDKAHKKLYSRASSKDSSVNVPGVTNLTTSLFTIAL